LKLEGRALLQGYVQFHVQLSYDELLQNYCTVPKKGPKNLVNLPGVPRLLVQVKVRN